jgi:siroheme decarboxylase
MNVAQSAALTGLEFALLNSFQRDFPLTPRPFATLAKSLETDEETVMQTLQQLQNRGVISRAGAVFRPNAIGASTLAALAVPAKRLDTVAHYVSSLAEINHNYEREHRFNLWFVATAPSAERLRAVLQEIEEVCECGPVLVLPMVEDYHIDLGFDLSATDAHNSKPKHAPSSLCLKPHATSGLKAQEQVLVSTLQNGLPFVSRPFECLGLPEHEAISTIARWVEQGVIKRFGVIVRHHELGYTANAMAVWDVPDEMVSAAGKRLADTGRVTLCYRRSRQLPDWRYNLFCMVHGKDRADVESRVAALSERCGLAAYPHDVLFSRRRFKQRGAHYAVLPEIAHG